MSEYINIDSNLCVSLGPEPVDVCINLNSPIPIIENFPRLLEIVSKSLPRIDPAVENAMFEAAGSSGRPVVTNSFFPPDPWLLTVSCVMWEGIIQGLSWDAIKLLVLSAIRKMQSAGVAPKQAAEVKSETGFRFMWSGQLEIGNLVKLYGKLEAKYSSLTAEERSKINPRKTKK